MALTAHLSVGMASVHDVMLLEAQHLPYVAVRVGESALVRPSIVGFDGRSDLPAGVSGFGDQLVDLGPGVSRQAHDHRGDTQRVAHFGRYMFDEQVVGDELNDNVVVNDDGNGP